MVTQPGAYSVPDARRRPAPTVAVLPAAAGAFTDFYRESRPRVVRALALTLGDTDLAAEATDEAMTRACQRWDQVHIMANPGGWVYRVGLNWARSVLRRRRLNRQPLYQPSVGAPEIGEPAVHRALAELSVDHRAVVVCRYLLGWTVEETANALDMPVGTVKSRLNRASKQLAARLAHLAPGARDASDAAEESR
jgi:RNA polymerase sigma-70 factor (ECF subfamily)